MSIPLLRSTFIMRSSSKQSRKKSVPGTMQTKQKLLAAHQWHNKQVQAPF